ncbi:hypothetical protein F5B19DRAFT_207612 [Rostrohypoxylon terebratum]|nr:hypothetical protein F5B19DRAFT_207612 [Rostrohypoxylon terebratum]
MRHFRCNYWIPILVYLAGVFASFPGRFNDDGSEKAKDRVVTRDPGFTGHHGFGDKGGPRPITPAGKGQGSSHGSHGIDSIVATINSADEQVHTVNLAIQNIKAGGTIEHLGSTLKSLTSTIKTTSKAISKAKTFRSDDVQSLRLAIQPLHKSIGSLVTQLVRKRDTIAGLCGCRAVQGAVNQIRSSTRVMFDGIKTRIASDHGIHGRNGFSDLHSLDSGIASFLNHGYGAFSFGSCNDFSAPSSLTYATPTTVGPSKTISVGVGTTATPKSSGGSKSGGSGGHTLGLGNTGH